MNKKISSPQPDVLMNFYKALQEVSLGKKIHKLEWKDESYYGIMDNGMLKLHKPDGQLYNWIINDGDLAGEDWIVVE